MIKFKKAFYIVASVLTICFIFYNSMQNGTTSTQASNTFLQLLNSFLALFNSSFSLTSHFVRKLAHFLEFFLLGFFLTNSFLAFSNKIKHFFGYTLFLSLIVPVLDEYIQLFSYGRSSQVSDVLLDFLSALCGIFFVMIFHIFKNKYNKKLKLSYK